MALTKLAEWSRAVKERDGKCMECGRAEDLHAHHIKPKSTHPELSLDVANGKTLCYRCHKVEHERMRTTRLRTDKPQRRTMMKRIAELEKTVAALKAALHRKPMRPVEKAAYAPPASVHPSDRFPNPWPAE